MTGLILKRAAASRSSGEWNDDAFDVLADDVVVGRIMKVHAAPVGTRSAGRRRSSNDRRMTASGTNATFGEYPFPPVMRAKRTSVVAWLAIYEYAP
jgi:hypothetical protein